MNSFMSLTGTSVAITPRSSESWSRKQMLNYKIENIPDKKYTGLINAELCVSSMSSND